VPPTWSAIGTGDINGDHERDVVWIQPGTGQVAIWLMGYPTTIMTVSFPANLGAATTMTLAGLGDLNGDGRADLVWRDTATGELRVWYMNAAGAIASSASYGIVPLQFELRGIGDFNNDGIADLLWYRPTDGVTAQWLMAPDGGFTAAFPGDRRDDEHAPGAARRRFRRRRER
jgi:hypothetical protein